MTRSRTVTCLAASLVVLLSAAPSFAQSQVLLLELQGIPGDSQVEGPGVPDGKFIDILSFSWGVSNAATIVAGISAGKPSFTDFTVSLYGGTAVPELVLRTATGGIIPTARFLVLQNTGDRLFATYELTFKNAVLTSFQSSGSTGDRPFHALSMAYEQLRITINTQQPDGTVTSTFREWNLVENKKK